jgi:hypothetical protein
MKLLKTILSIISSLCIASISSAQWYDMPISTSNPAYTPQWQDYNWVKTNINPNSQLYDSYCEKYQIHKTNACPPGYYDDRVFFYPKYIDHYENLIVNVGSLQYTNKIPITNMITITNDPCINTNLISTWPVTWTDKDGHPQSGTLMPSMTYADLLYIPYHVIFDTMFTDWVLTNDVNSANNFNDWFNRTDSLGNRPTDFPQVTASRIFYNELGTNHVAPLTNDGWGIIVPISPDASHDNFRFSRDGNLRSCLLAESVCYKSNDYPTIMWSFKPIASLPLPPSYKGPRQVKTLQRPVLTYNTTNSLPVGVEFKVYGWAITNIEANYDNYGIPVETNETVSISESNNVLTYFYYQITNITCDTVNDTMLGDSANIQYTNGVMMYYGITEVYAGGGDYYGPSPVAQELDANDFNERYKVFNVLRWLREPIQTSQGHIISYDWSYSGNVSFDDSRAQCMSSTPVVTTNTPFAMVFQTGYRTMSPCVFTQYTYDFHPISGPWTYTCWAHVDIYYPIIGIGITPYTIQTCYGTNFNHTIDIYYKFTSNYDHGAAQGDPGGGIFYPNYQWNTQGIDLGTYSTNHFVYHDTIPSTKAVIITNTISLGNIGIPPSCPTVWYTPTPTPETGNYTGTFINVGWRLDDARSLYKFDVEGGFTKR